jgi:uncharacterized protein (TIGR03000 family)
MMKRTAIWSVVALVAGGLLGYGTATGRLSWGAAAHAAPQTQQAVIPFEVLVPADAALDIAGTRTRQTGIVRHFQTPPVEVGRPYTYTVKATWQGKEVTKDLDLKFGGNNVLDLRGEFATGEPARTPVAAGLMAAPAGSPRATTTTPGNQLPPQQNEDQQTVNSQAQKNPPAATIDFRKQLGLPFGSLATLGSRIDTARRDHDPVTLANAASELAVAENVAGKRASLTSTVLLKEAAQLAKLRKEAVELQAVERVASQIETETQTVTDLKKAIALAQQVAKSATDAIRRNEEPTDVPRRVQVNNYTTQYCDIWVNGNLRTQLSPGQSKWLVIDHLSNPTVLEAYGNEDNSTWGPRYIWGRFQTYTWNLN